MPLYNTLLDHQLRGSVHLDPLRATGHIAETFSRVITLTAGATSVTGRETLVGIVLSAGQVVSAITMGCNTAMTTGTHQWFTLRNSSRGLIRTTADDIDTAWSTQSNKTLALSRIISDAEITSGTATLDSATAAFTSADVGKRVTIEGAGAAGVLYGTSAVPRTILSVESATSCTLSANASTTVAGAVAYIQTPYTVPTSGFYYIGIMVAATTPPQVLGQSFLSGQLNGLAPILCGVDNTNTGLTVPSGAPATSAALTAFTLGIWAAVS